MIRATDEGVVLGMRRVVDRVGECAPPAGSPTNRLMPGLTHIRYLVLHQTSLARQGPDNPIPVPDEDLDGPKLARIFRENPKPRPDGLGTGGYCPYHILITAGGRAEQLLPLSAVGAHAPGYNHQSVAVAVVGNFHDVTPSPSQMRALVRVCLDLVPLNGALNIGGHTVTFGASSDLGKVCPGPGLRIPDVVRLVTDRLAHDGAWRHRGMEKNLWALKLGGYVA